MDRQPKINFENRPQYAEHKGSVMKLNLYIYISGFSLGCLHMGGGGTSAVGQSVNGGGDIDLMGGPNFDRL